MDWCGNLFGIPPETPYDNSCVCHETSKNLTFYPKNWLSFSKSVPMPASHNLQIKVPCSGLRHLIGMQIFLLVLGLGIALVGAPDQINGNSSSLGTQPLGQKLSQKQVELLLQALEVVQSAG
jgi:hypothetical protein